MACVSPLPSPRTGERRSRVLLVCSALTCMTNSSATTMYSFDAAAAAAAAAANDDVGRATDIVQSWQPTLSEFARCTKCIVFTMFINVYVTRTRRRLSCYHPRTWRGNILGRIRLCVCLSLNKCTTHKFHRKRWFKKSGIFRNFIKSFF